VTSFVQWALSLLAPPCVPYVPAPIPQGMAWCSGKLCDTWRDFDVLPGNSAYPGPAWVICCFCGEQIDLDLPEPEEAA
jgi:hypothetical protein